MNREEKYIGKAERYLHLFESEIEPEIFLLSASKTHKATGGFYGFISDTIS